LELYFKAGGASVSFDAAPGELTFARLGLWNAEPYLVVVRGEVVDLPEEERKRVNAQTDPTWPHVHARFFCEYEEFVNIFPCNHILAVAGDKVEILNYLAEIAGIKSIILGDEGKKREVPVWERLK
jgi:L-fucose isomerase